MTKRIILITLGLLLLGAGCQSNNEKSKDKKTESTTPVPTSTVENTQEENKKKFKEFKDEKFNLSFMYPADWTYSNNTKNRLDIVFYDDKKREVASVLSLTPNSDVGMGIGDNYISIGEEKLVAKDKSPVKLSLLRECTGTIKNGSCSQFGGLEGEAIWKDVLFRFFSNEKSDSLEEKRLIEIFKEMLRSLGPAK